MPQVLGIFVGHFNIPNTSPPTRCSRKLDSAGNPSIAAARVIPPYKEIGDSIDAP